MLQPKRVKYRKAQRGRMKGVAQRGATLAFGDFGLKALEPCWLTNRQLEAGAWRSPGRSSGGKIWIRVFPDKPFTKKPPRPGWARARATPSTGWPSSSRAGSSTRWKGLTEDVAREAFRLAGQKLPIGRR